MDPVIKRGTMKPQSIVIAHGLPDTNSGGSALGIALVNVLQKTFPDADLAYLSSHADPRLIEKAYPHIRERHPGLAILPFPIRARADNCTIENSTLRKLQNLWWVVVTFASLVFLVFPALGRWNASLDRIRKSTVVVSRGTNIFYDKRGHFFQNIVSKLWLCFPLLYAWRVGVPFVIYAQTIGPIHSPIVQRLLRFVLNRAAMILPREQYSYDYLKRDLRIPERRLTRVPDSVFGLEPPATEQIGKICARFKLPQKKYLCLVVRKYMEKGSKTEGLLDKFTAVAKHVLARKTCDRVVVVTQCHDLPEYGGFECDAEISRQLVERLEEVMPGKVSFINESLSPVDAMSIYGGARYLVSVRLHAAIFALISGTPAIAVSYWGTKTRGIFQMLGFDDAFVEKEAMSSEVVISKLLDIDQDYHRYCADMSQKVERAYQDAQKTPLVFSDLFSSDVTTAVNTL